MKRISFESREGLRYRRKRANARRWPPRGTRQARSTGEQIAVQRDGVTVTHTKDATIIDVKVE